MIYFCLLIEKIISVGSRLLSLTVALALTQDNDRVIFRVTMRWRLPTDFTSAPGQLRTRGRGKSLINPSFRGNDQADRTRSDIRIRPSTTEHDRAKVRARRAAHPGAGDRGRAEVEGRHVFGLKL